MAKNIIKFPAGNARRRRKKTGKGIVPCMETERWLQFPDESSGYFEQGEFIEVAVMTYSPTKERPRKICDLLVTREDLLTAINSITPPDADA
jgi:hypothetical protein